MSGKPGRPPEDRLQRQREIFRAVAPLIERGVRELTMRQAARAANMSLGGLYHYFRTKQELVLHGTMPAAFDQICHDFYATYGHLEEQDPEAFLEAYIAFTLDEATFVRPSLIAALELGLPVFLSEVERGVELGLEGFVGALRTVAPELDQASVDDLGRSIRRVVIASMLDRNLTRAQIENDLRALVAGWRALRSADARIPSNGGSARSPASSASRNP